MRLLGLNRANGRAPAGDGQLGTRPVREVMLPRADLVAIPLTASEAEVREVAGRERLSHYPVFAASLDDIVGVLAARDLRAPQLGAPFSLARALREPLFVPDTRPAQRVLDDLRKTRAPIAIVLDESGGTAGLVTLAQLVEQVVGEFDAESDDAPLTAGGTDRKPGPGGRRGAAGRVRRTEEPGRDGAR
ncbi:MAG: hypothetical protein KGL38_07745 [Gemmatimonadota bacterium]|nr:hypothetical protein [Gemmatimonadota bacterium]